MIGKYLNTCQQLWEGERWRWWSLIGGVLLVPASAAVAALIGFLTGERLLPLLLTLLIAQILVVSVIGSGVLESMTSRMTRGGLTRESTDFVDRVESEADLDKIEALNRQLRDRRTIRSGIIAVPLIAAFIALLMRT